MQVNNPPPGGITVEHDSPPSEALRVAKMKRDEHDIPSHLLDMKIFGHKVVEGGTSGVRSANLLEDAAKPRLDRLAPARSLGRFRGWEEDRGIVRKAQAERFPIEVLECPEEAKQRNTNSGRIREPHAGDPRGGGRRPWRRLSASASRQVASLPERLCHFVESREGERDEGWILPVGYDLG